MKKQIEEHSSDQRREGVSSTFFMSWRHQDWEASSLPHLGLLEGDLFWDGRDLPQQDVSCTHLWLLIGGFRKEVDNTADIQRTAVLLRRFIGWWAWCEPLHLCKYLPEKSSHVCTKALHGNIPRNQIQGGLSLWLRCPVFLRLSSPHVADSSLCPLSTLFGTGSSQGIFCHPHSPPGDSW